MRFLNLLGNDALKSRVLKSFDAGRIPHAMLISGARGSGRRTLARDIAAALLCSGENVPCGRCAGCAKMSGGGHPDFILAEGSGATVQVGVDTVREMRAQAHVLPVEAEYKVFCVAGEGVTPAAQNALLKTLEEPPPRVVFMIIARSTMDMLPTVRSRCARMAMLPLREDIVVKELTCRFPEAGKQSVLHAARLSQGILGRATAFLSDAAFGDVAKLCADYAERMASNDLYGMLTLARSIGSGRAQYETALELLTIMLRDILMLKSGARLPCAFDHEALAHAAAAMTNASLAGIIEHVQDAYASLRSNVTPQLSAAALAVRCHETLSA